MKETIASNLIRYRKGLHISQQSLAEQTGVTRQTINNYEKAKTLPDSKTLSVLAKILGVTLDDILRPIDQLPQTNNFCFRCHCKFTQKPQFISYVENLLNAYTALEVAVGLPPYSPETTPCNVLEGNENRIQQIAKSFRLRLGIGDAPIPNLFEAVEELGLKVLRLPVEQKDFFGLSACSNSQGAFVLINTHNISIERQLFTLAHEIGHLIFHRDEYQNQLMISESREEQKAREKVADYFASHLLVSKTAFDLARQNMNNLVELKTYFRVSYTMILKRLDELGIDSYGEMIKKIRANYKRLYNKSLTKEIELEPKLAENNFPVNQRYQTLIWKALKAEKISESKAAELLNITIEALRLARMQQEVYAIA
ncbi:XRE family transcriptional regulator [Cyanobacterium aponinum UTEX 3221]|uniref:XRE family transcriptional regulator n=1 Tax=Cyanobacterium aponinum TaxID=379064 RepID=UPI002B4BDBEE|nr:XRE family transcriptional regulator [Cyanobacterium aponinum]WRL37983.1 XRE family transcriptional regulator [Cyanobacterium aponinum UTEX 3221]